MQGGDSLFSQVGASQAFDFQITESQLQSQVDFSFLDFNQTQETAFDVGGLQGASQVSIQLLWMRNEPASLLGRALSIHRRRSCRHLQACRCRPSSLRRAMRL